MLQDNEAPQPTDEVIVDGASNFRDLGGTEVAGGRIAARRLFRSDALERITDVGLAALNGLGVRVVCDLRTTDERERNPTRWPSDRGPEVLDLAGATDLAALRPERLRSLYADTSGGRARGFMLELYRQMPVVFGPALEVLAERIAERGQLPALVHCAAGRDRTGVVCAMLLVALGAERGVISREHLRGGEEFGTVRLREVVRGITGTEPPPAVVDAFRPQIDYLDAALEAAGTRHGSLDAYLAALGLDDARRSRLHDALVESDRHDGSLTRDAGRSGSSVSGGDRRGRRHAAGPQ